MLPRKLLMELSILLLMFVFLTNLPILNLNH